MLGADNIRVRKSQDRGHVNLGWLDSYHTFSFGEYRDPAHRGFRSLRVINEDRIEPGQGFGEHPHRDMEIITYVINGALAHKDSLGNGSVIEAGNAQKMSAGKGVVHSEYNASKEHRVHLLQIWIIPSEKGLEPSYEEVSLKDRKDEGLVLIGSPKKQEGAVLIHQDAKLYRGRFSQGQAVDYPIEPGRGVWAQMIDGNLEINGENLLKSDGAAIENEKNLSLYAEEDSEFLLFDMK